MRRAVTFLFLVAFASTALAVPQPDDLVFEGGWVVDGTGAPAFRGDVAVRDGRISFVGTLPEARKAAAKKRIDARGRYVCPGFIDLLGQSEYNVLVDPRAASKVTQGITTEVTGEGMSIAPTNERMLATMKDVFDHYGVQPDWRTLGDYLARLDAHPAAINLGTFVGLGSVRDVVIGEEERRATPEELSRMEKLVEEAMEEGALGVSTSLQYVPDMYNSTEEIIAMARVAAKMGGVYFTHQRSEGNRLDASMEEVFRIAREAKIPADIWHFKAAYKENWGRMPELLEKIRRARAEGLDVAANQYPWEAAENGLDACLPPWIREGGRDRLLERLKDPSLRARAKHDVETGGSDWENQYLGAGGARGIMVATVINPELKKFEGRTLAEIGAAEHKDPIDAMMDIIAKDNANTYCIQFIMSEQDVRVALKSPLVAFCTDSGAQAEDGILREKSHPRGWASTARILGHYVRDEHVLRLEDAVAKMTSRSAARAHLFDRGLLRPGMAADVVVFDLARVKANATYLDPIHYSSGYRDVAVNGVLVVEDGAMTAARPGQVLRGPGWRGAAARAGFSRPGSANAARERRGGPGSSPGRTARRAR